MKMKQDFLLLQKIEVESSSIVLSDIEQAKQDKEGSKKADVFIVKDAGPGRWDFGTFIKTDVNKGEMVLIAATFTFSPKNEPKKMYTFGKARDVIASY